MTAQSTNPHDAGDEQMIHHSDRCQRFYTISLTRAWRFIPTRIGAQAALERQAWIYDTNKHLERLFMAELLRAFMQLGLDVVQRELQRRTVPLGQVQHAMIQAGGGRARGMKPTLGEARHAHRVQAWGLRSP